MNSAMMKVRNGDQNVHHRLWCTLLGNDVTDR